MGPEDRAKHRPPGTCCKFLNWLPRLLLMTRPHHSERWSKKAYSRRNYRPSVGSRFAAAAAAAASSPDLVELTEVRRTGRVKRRPILGPIVTSLHDELHGSTNADPSAGFPFRLTAETRSAVEAVQFVAAHLKNEDDYAEVEQKTLYFVIGSNFVTL